MTLKDHVLLTLYRSFSQEISGEKLAEEWGVTRAAIWKAVDSLRKDGYDIHSSSGKGYALVSMQERLCLPCIERSLQKEDRNVRVFYEERMDSTNNEAKRLLASDVSTPFLLLTSEQSAGRGRLGRSFFSPSGGLYLSLVVSDFPLLSGGVRYTAATALAVAQALESAIGEEISIKWVNDLYYRGKKVCGILTEGIFDMENSRLSHLVVGVGINIKEVSFPEEIKDRAGYVPVDSEKKTELVIDIVRNIFHYFSLIEDPAFLEGYRARCFVLEQPVQFTKNGRTLSGKATAIDDWGGLVVETEDEIFTLQSGEVFLEEEVSVDFQLRSDTLGDRDGDDHLD